MRTTKNAAHGSGNSSQPGLFPMEKLTDAASVMCNQTTLKDSSSVTSLREFWGGASLSNSPAGLKIDHAGPALAPVKVFPAPGKAMESTIRDISGLLGSGLSVSADLNGFLANKLKQQLSTVGSMEYVMTWKEKVTPRGRRYWAHVASPRPTSGSGSTGWRTPNAMPENRGGLQTNPQKALDRAQQGHQVNLDDQACMAGWPTPMAASPATENYNEAGDSCNNGSNGGPSQANGALSADAALAGWCSPTAQDGNRGNKPPRPHDTGIPLSQQVVASGAITNSSPAPMEKRGGCLNPAFSLWIQGYPVSWMKAGVKAMAQFVRSRKTSKAASDSCAEPETP